MGEIQSTNCCSPLIEVALPTEVFRLLDTKMQEESAHAQNKSQPKVRMREFLSHFCVKQSETSVIVKT